MHSTPPNHLKTLKPTQEHLLEHFTTVSLDCYFSLKGNFQIRLHWVIHKLQTNIPKRKGKESPVTTDLLG